MENTIDQELISVDNKIDKPGLEPETIKAAKVNIGTYLAAAMYGVLENNKILLQDTTGRATSGLKGILDNNTGDGVFVGINTLAADVILGVVDRVAKKVGGKGIKPEIRFLSALTVGVAMTTYMESRSDFLIGMKNTPDFAWGGDMFGIALGAAAILAGKVFAERVDPIKINDWLKKKMSKSTTQEFESLSEKIANNLEGGENAKTTLVEQSSEELAQLIIQEE